MQDGNRFLRASLEIGDHFGMAAMVKDIFISTENRG
jgi:hypothetical protein